MTEQEQAGAATSAAGGHGIVFELCAETMDACLAAREGGADRIELCSSLIEGGLTPSHGLIRQAVAQAGLPVHVLLRPRPGNFVYGPADFGVLQADLAHLHVLGARGAVFGLLEPDGRVDVPRTRMLVEQAGSLEVTFHRAFDETPSLEEALEDLIAAGCARVLTSGGTGNVHSGSAVLARLVRQARGRIAVAAGGGLRASQAAELARATGATHFHGSVRRLAGGAAVASETPWLAASAEVVPADIAAMMGNLRAGTNARV